MWATVGWIGWDVPDIALTWFVSFWMSFVPDGDRPWRQECLVTLQISDQSTLWNGRSCQCSYIPFRMPPQLLKTSARVRGALHMLIGIYQFGRERRVRPNLTPCCTLCVQVWNQCDVHCRVVRAGRGDMCLHTAIYWSEAEPVNTSVWGWSPTDLFKIQMCTKAETMI